MRFFTLYILLLNYIIIINLVQTKTINTKNIYFFVVRTIKLKPCKENSRFYQINYLTFY